MPPSRIRILVVDDSAFARKVLRETLSLRADMEVVGTARDGLEALEKIAQLKPDVVTLDLMMPQLDGLGVLRGLPLENPPRVVVVSMSGNETEPGLEALALGAVDLVVKPTALATDRLYQLGDELIRKVEMAGRLATVRVPAAIVTPLPMPRALRRQGVVVMGASTGGPQALTHVLHSLPAEFPLPVAVVLHIPEEYTAPFARRVDAESAISVVEAQDAMPLMPGTALVARGAIHLKFRRTAQGVVTLLERTPADELHMPSVDVLFRSAAEIFGRSVLGVVLTGMGSDGLRGAQAIRRAGGVVLTEAESSCVVYGMPRSVVEAGFSSESASLEDMARAILRRVSIPG